MWQALHDELLHPAGIELVTVALDVDADAARPFIDAAEPTHPSLIDARHTLDSHFGVVNVPTGIWLDEDGMIVRPPEPAFPGRSPVTESLARLDVSTLPADVAEILVEARKIKSDPDQYLAMLRDWAAHGARSRYVLTSDEVLRRSQPRSTDEARAAAEFELGEHLHRQGNHAAAIPHWRAAHRLHPANWTYKRQAWNFEDPVRQGRTSAYDGSWIDDVRAIGAENYYAPLTP